MKLNFVIHEDYFIAHVLHGMTSDRFSSQKYKKDIVAFKNYAWHKSKKLYDFLIARFYPETWLDYEVIKLTQELPDYLRTLKQSSQFNKLYVQTNNYLKTCESQWEANYKTTVHIMKNLTGLNFDKIFTVFITHPGLKNGCYLGKDKIAWGHTENWPNHTTVYLWHEILHSYFATSDTDHVIICFLTDEELRIRLNGGEYPPFIMYKEFFPLTKKVLPDWRDYLRLEKKDINNFRERLARKFKSQQSIVKWDEPATF